MRLQIKSSFVTSLVLLECTQWALENSSSAVMIGYINVTFRPISRQRPKYSHATIEPVSQEGFYMWFAYIHCWETDGLIWIRLETI
jgi:hypothetical protein